MPLRIYGIARTRAFRALWMASELGLDYEHLPIEIGGANPDAEAAAGWLS
jgi:glutathione S-transferase